MIERPETGIRDFDATLQHYMESKGWTVEEQRDMFHYIGHHIISAEGTINVLTRAEQVRARQDIECMTTEHGDYE